MATAKKRFFTPKNDLSYEEIVAIQKSIAANEYEINADIVLPINPKFSYFGNKIAFCQIINYWFAKHPNSNIRIYDNYFPKDEPEIIKAVEKLVLEAEVSTLLGLCFGVKNKILGYAKKGKEYTSYFIQPLLNKLIFDYRELSINYSNEKSFSNEYFQIHPDFLESDLYNNNLIFYKKIGAAFYLQNESNINPVSEKLFARLQTFNDSVKFAWLKQLQTFFYEIFDNAFKWARIDWLNSSDLDQKPIEKSNRIFFIGSKNFTNLASADKTIKFNLDQQLSNFAQINTARSHWGADTKLLELSFLDNGLGIVQTFKKVNLDDKVSILEEYDHLMNAFAFGRTSETSSKATIRGIGLYKVITNSKGVFLILRTGRLHLYRNFETHPYRENERLFLFDVSDGTNDQETIAANLKKYSSSQGTLFTFLIPLLKNV